MCMPARAQNVTGPRTGSRSLGHAGDPLCRPAESLRVAGVTIDEGPRRRRSARPCRRPHSSRRTEAREQPLKASSTWVADKTPHNRSSLTDQVGCRTTPTASVDGDGWQLPIAAVEVSVAARDRR